MEQIKNIQFTILIKADGHLREFNFRKSSGITGNIFMVDVADLAGTRHYIEFHEENNQWVLKTTDLPDWLIEVVPRIYEAIKQF